MDKAEKAAIARQNSERFKTGRPNYTGVDGRTYMLDRKTPSGKANIRTAAVRNRRDRPSMAAVYRIEHWLLGKGRYTKSYIPAAEQKRIIAEYGLVFSRRLQQYSAPEEQVWAKFTQRFPEALAREQIACYAELQYRAAHKR